MNLNLREYIPLEQGLRRCTLWIYERTIVLREHIPLEQGLRHVYWCTKFKSLLLQEHIPAEQGLRLKSKELSSIHINSPRVYYFPMLISSGYADCLLRSVGLPMVDKSPLEIRPKDPSRERSQSASLEATSKRPR